MPLPEVVYGQTDTHISTTIGEFHYVGYKEAGWRRELQYNANI